MISVTVMVESNPRRSIPSAACHDIPRRFVRRRHLAAGRLKPTSGDGVAADHPGPRRPGRGAKEIASISCATDGTKWIWRLDIAVLVRHDACMDRHALERLGHHVVSRRVALGYRNRTDLADSLAFTVRTLADIEHGVRKASPGTYAMLENKLAWAPGSIDTILAGGEPKEIVVQLRRTNP